MKGRMLAPFVPIGGGKGGMGAHPCIPEAEDRAEVEVARGSSVFASRKSTKSESRRRTRI